MHILLSENIGRECYTVVLIEGVNEYGSPKGQAIGTLFKEPLDGGFQFQGRATNRNLPAKVLREIADKMEELNGSLECQKYS